MRPSFKNIVTNRSGSAWFSLLKYLLSVVLVVYLLRLFSPDFTAICDYDYVVLAKLLLVSVLLQLVIAVRLYLMVLSGAGVHPPRLDCVVAHSKATLLNYLPLPIGVGYRFTYLVKFQSMKAATWAFFNVTYLWVAFSVVVFVVVMIWTINTMIALIATLGCLIYLLLNRRVAFGVFVSVLGELILFVGRVSLIVGGMFNFEHSEVGFLLYYSNMISSLIGILPGGIGLSEGLAVFTGKGLDLDASLILGVSIVSRLCDVLASLLILFIPYLKQFLSKFYGGLK